MVVNNFTRQTSQYTDEELKAAFLEAEKKIGKTPTCREMAKLGFPSSNFYIKRFKSWNNFLLMMGKPITKKVYTKKSNPKRFFFPAEYNKFLHTISNPNHKFWLEFLLHTGMRYHEAKGVEVRDINFQRDMILVKNAKGGHGQQREIIISNYLSSRIAAYIKIKNLGKLDTLKFPSIQFAERLIKKQCTLAGINDQTNFSCHTFRKTLENWLVALNINIFDIQQHMGHTLDVAHVHYIANQYITQDDKVLIRSILGNLFQK